MAEGVIRYDSSKDPPVKDQAKAAKAGELQSEFGPDGEYTKGGCKVDKHGRVTSPEGIESGPIMNPSK